MVSTRRARWVASAAALTAFVATATLVAGKPAWYLSRGVALGGYDAVAYFVHAKAVKGDPSLEIEWQGARWRFASAENRERFQTDPARYAPQFGGYCAWAVSRGYTASGDPQAWSVVDGRLYINYSTSVRAMWVKDAPRNIVKGQANWPGVLEK